MDGAVGSATGSEETPLPAFPTPPAPPTFPTTPTGPTTAPGGAPVTGGITPTRGGATTRRGTHEESDGWERWWRWNGEPYLAVARTRQPTTIPFEDPVRRELLPRLLALLERDDAQLVARDLLAIARVTPSASTALVVESVRRRLGSADASVRDAALLALGILGDTDSLAPVVDVLHDTPSGRLLMREESGIACSRRQLAALSLGLAGGPKAASALLAATRGRVCPDLCAAALLAAAKAAPSDTLVASTALGFLRDERLDATVRAHAAMALSKMQIGRAALPFLVELAHARDTAAELRGASIVAIGSLAAIDDAPATAELVRATCGGETRARGLACVALGRVLERDPKATRVEAARRPLVDALVQVAFGDKSADRPWALLGLGIALRDDPTSELRTSAVTRVRELVTKTSRPDLEAAGALALGLMRDGEGSSMLEARLDDRPSTAVSIALLQGIGMGGGNYLAGSVRTLALADSTLPAVRVEAARTLALLGDAGSADALVRQLPEARGSEETAALARALGKLRHERGILPLAALFDAAKGSEPVRHEATAALADLADRQPCAWWTAYSIDQDPQLRAPTLSALLPR